MWLRVSNESKIQFDQGRYSKDARESVHRVLENWKTIQSDTAFNIALPAALDEPTGLGLFLAADTVAGRINRRLVSELATVLDTEKSRLQPTLRLFLPGSRETPAQLTKSLSASQGATFVVGTRGESGLDLLAADDASLRHGLTFLTADSLRGLCNLAICVGDRIAPTTMTKAAQSAEKLADDRHSVVWSLGDTDYKHGWHVREAGHHNTRFVWSRPGDRELTEPPMILLRAKISQSEVIDSAKSAVTVRVREQPIATYPLSQWKSDREAWIPIPRSMWADREWVIDLSVLLVPKDGDSCSRIDGEMIWVTVDPTTSLHARFKPRAVQRISDFFDASIRADLPPLTLAKGAPIDKPLIARLLRPFALDRRSASKVDSVEFWTLVDETRCKKHACIKINQYDANTAGLVVKGAQLSDGEGLLATPRFDVNRTATLSLNNTGDRPTLHVNVPANVSRIEPPNYRTLDSELAVWTDRWVALNAVERRDALAQKVEAPRAASVNLTQRESVVRRVNLLWAAVAFLAVLFTVALLWRKPKGKKPDDRWEIHST